MASSEKGVTFSSFVFSTTLHFLPEIEVFINPVWNLIQLNNSPLIIKILHFVLDKCYLWVVKYVSFQRIAKPGLIYRLILTTIS